MSDKLRTARPPRPFSAPRLQLTVMRRAESFVCRRCVDRGYLGAEEAFDAPYHFHPEIELLLMESSHGTRYVADSIEPYGPGDLVLIGANVPHVFAREPGADPASKVAASIVIQFLPGFLGDGFFARPEMHEVQQLLVAANHGIHFGARTVRWARPQMLRLLTAQGAQRVALLLDILGRLAREPARALASSAFRQQIKAQDIARLNQIRGHVEKTFHLPIAIAEVAKLVSLSPTSFSRWFSAATGKPFIQFLTDVRMAHAFHSLTETGKPITEISFDCGFNSVSHFIHRFRAIRGMSPRQFRRHVAAGLEDMRNGGSA